MKDKHINKKAANLLQKSLNENNINVKVLCYKKNINNSNIFYKDIIYFEYKNKEYNIEHEFNLIKYFEIDYKDTRLEKIERFIKEIDNEDVINRCDNNKEIR